MIGKKKCRQGSSTYGGQFFADIYFQKGDAQPELINRRMGVLPIMIKVNGFCFDETKKIKVCSFKKLFSSRARNVTSAI